MKVAVIKYRNNQIDFGSYGDITLLYNPEMIDSWMEVTQEEYDELTAACRFSSDYKYIYTVIEKIEKDSLEDILTKYRDHQEKARLKREAELAKRKKAAAERAAKKKERDLKKLEELQKLYKKE